ncbi:MAG: hypothetical protein ACE5K0_00285 [Candidatus Methanofastidiosia archaeon]
MNKSHLIYLLIMLALAFSSIDFDGYSTTPSIKKANIESPSGKIRVLLDDKHQNPSSDVKLFQDIFDFYSDTPPFFPLHRKFLSNYQVLLIFEPTSSFLESEISDILSYVEEGGTLVVMSNWTSYVNELLESFKISVKRDVVFDFKSYVPTYRGRSPSSYIVLDQTFDFSLERELYLNHSSSLEFRGEWKTLKASRESFSRQLHEEGYPGIIVKRGDLALMAMREYGMGRVVVIGDSLDMRYSNNKKFISDLISNLASPKLESSSLYFKLMEFQKELELQPSSLDATIMLERAWSSYFKEDSFKTEKYLKEGKSYFENPSPPNLKNRYGISIFLIKVLLIFSLFAIGTFKLREIDFYIKAGFFLILLLTFYLSTQPQGLNYERVYNPSRLVLQESVPVELIGGYMMGFEFIDENERVRFVEEFVRSRVSSEPERVEFYTTPLETLRRMGEDCDGQAFLAASLLENLGYKTELVFGIGHVWVETEGERILNPLNTYHLRVSKEGIEEIDYLELTYALFNHSLKIPILFLMCFSILLSYHKRKMIQKEVEDTFIMVFLFFLVFYFTLELSYYMHLLVFPALFIYIFWLRLSSVSQSLEEGIRRGIKLRAFIISLIIGILAFTVPYTFYFTWIFSDFLLKSETFGEMLYLSILILVFLLLYIGFTRTLMEEREMVEFAYLRSIKGKVLKEIEDRVHYVR